MVLNQERFGPSPGDIWQYLETFVVTMEGWGERVVWVLLAYSG